MPFVFGYFKVVGSVGGSIVTEEELEQIIEKARIDRTQRLSFIDDLVDNLPEKIGNLNLTELNLYLFRVQFESIPESIGNLIHLTELNLSVNRITKLPGSIGNLSNLKKLSLDSNKLTELPDSIGNLSNLITLDVHDNKLSKLSETIGNLCNLVYLQSWLNQLNYLPESVCNLSNLDTLNVSWNQLSSLPENIGLSKLTCLDLRNNEMITLPESICNLSGLTTLDLGYNKIVSLPDDIGNLTRLEKLHLSGNQLTHLPKSIEKLTSLTYIDISGNPLYEDISVLQILSNLPNLESVYFLGVELPRRYWLSSFSEWKPEWLLDEENVEIRRILIQEVGYEKICQELNANKIDDWREYTLLRIDDVEQVYDEDTDEEVLEPMVLLKMTCPSTGHIHILRVPPAMTSAEAAITWVNHGIHPDEFAVQT